MSEITISTSNYKTTRDARIDGALYEVRRIGAGDQLDISRLASKLVAVSRTAMNARGKMNALKGADEKTQTKMLSEINAALDAVATAQTDLENCYIKLFTAKDDKGDAAALVHSIGVDGINAVLAQIFNAKPEEKTDGGN